MKPKMFIRNCLNYLCRGPTTLWTSIVQGEFPHISDPEALRLFAAEFEFELNHLKNASATVESGGTAQVVDSSNGGQTPSRLLFGQDFDEVNRTLVSMLALKWILNDDYTTFTAGQPPHAQLSRPSFQHMREYFRRQLQTHEQVYDLLVAMAVDDIGKDSQLADNCHANLNHSEVVFECAKAGKIPSLRQLQLPSRTAIMKCLEIGNSLNLSQLVQGENVPASLSIAREFGENCYAYDLRAMVTLLDVAGAAAHRNAHGCIVMTESVYQAYVPAIEAVRGFIQGTIPDERSCYNQVLAARAQSLHGKGFDLLSTDNTQERALLRILCMGRVDNKELATCFNSAFTQLPDGSRQSLVDGLSVDGVDDDVAVLPYYAPGLLAEVLRNVNDRNDSVAVIRAVSAFMQFLARVYAGSRPQSETRDAVIERDLSFAQHVIKSGDFANDPFLLVHVDIPWDTS